jgi:hypothetical protein
LNRFSVSNDIYASPLFFRNPPLQKQVAAVTGIVINLHSIKGNTTLYLCYSWGGFLAGFSWGGFLANEFSRN